MRFVEMEKREKVTDDLEITYLVLIALGQFDYVCAFSFLSRLKKQLQKAFHFRFIYLCFQFRSSAEETWSRVCRTECTTMLIHFKR